MRTLKAALADYLRIRHAEGAQFTKVGAALEHFVEFVNEQDADHVTVELAVEWALLTTGATDRHRANRLTMARGFAAYLHAIDPAHEVPPWGLLPSGKPRTGAQAGPFSARSDTRCRSRGSRDVTWLGDPAVGA